jgi:hypothetical protein
MAPRRIISALIWMSAFPILRIMGHLALQLPAKAAFAFHWGDDRSSTNQIAVPNSVKAIASADDVVPVWR